MGQDLDALRRWETGGAAWQVLARQGGVLDSPLVDSPLIDIALLTCDMGEQVGRIRSSEPELLAYVGDRDRSDD